MQKTLIALTTTLLSAAAWAESPAITSDSLTVQDRILVIEEINVTAEKERVGTIDADIAAMLDDIEAEEAKAEAGSATE